MQNSGAGKERDWQRVLLVLLMVGAWWPAIHAGFFWDDQQVVVESVVLAERDVVGAVLGGLFSPHPEAAVAYHRPVTTLSLMVDRMMFGVEPAGYHVHNLVLHLMVVLGVYGLVRGYRRVSGDVGAAPLLVALLFGLHPGLSEAVLWISARGDLLVALGVVGTLWLLSSGRTGWGQRVLLFGAALLTPLCKETGYLLPLFVGGWSQASGRRLRRGEGWALGGGVAGALVLRVVAELGRTRSAEGSPIDPLEVVGRAAVFAASWVSFPWPLTSITSAHNPVELGVAGGAAVSAVGLGWLWWRGGSGARWWLGLAVVAWIPTLVAVIRTGLFGERYLYLPMVFLVLALGTLRVSRRWGAVAGLWLVVAVGILQVRIPEWEREARLVEQAVARRPAGVALLLLGKLREAEGQLDEALYWYEAALAGERPVLAACAPAMRRWVARGDPAAAEGAAARLAARGCEARAAFRDVRDGG